MSSLLLSCLFCAAVLGTEATSPPPSASASSIQLANQHLHDDALQAVISKRPSEDDGKALYQWLWSYAQGCFDDRRYADAESACRTLLALVPQYHGAHSNLSVALGKQGKWQEALQEAEIAKLLHPADSMHADEIACSWLFALGRTQEALTRFQAIPVPTDPEKRSLYWPSRACFYATVGNQDEIRQAMVTSLQVAPDSRVFFATDVVFDAYRSTAWFIELIGKTLK